MTVKLLTEHHLELLSLNGGCTGSSESINVKMPHCLKSHIAALMFMRYLADNAFVIDWQNHGGMHRQNKSLQISPVSKTNFYTK